MSTLYITDSIADVTEIKTFSSVVNNDDILQMYLKQIGRKKMLTKKEEKQVDSNVPQVQETTQFDLVMLNKAWKEYIDRIPEKKILSSTMQGCTLTIKDNFFIEIAVDNPMQEDELLSERASLTSWLSKSLKNGKIKLYTRVNESGENKKALSPNERFIEMIQNNEHIGTLAKELELEI